MEFATGNERNLCGHFAKAWTIFLEHILFFKDELYLEFKDLGSSSKSCDLDFILSASQFCPIKQDYLIGLLGETTEVIVYESDFQLYK